MKKKILAVLTSLMLMVGLFTVMPMTVSAADEVTAYYNGSGLFSDEGCTSSPISNVDRSNITSVIIKAGVTSIQSSAFDKCISLTSVTIPNGVSSIGSWAFGQCFALDSITIPNGVLSVGSWAFGDCWNLTSVIIPNSVKSIGESAFNGCTRLTSVTIPDSVTSIGTNAFNDCQELNNSDVTVVYTSTGSIDTLAVQLNGKIPNFTGIGSIKSVIIADGVTSIGNGAFKNCTGLTSVIIPNSVTSIGEAAFENCTGLTSITIPNSVKSIGERVFNYCTGLKSIIISDSVTSIANGTFANCTGLTSVTIPNSVKSIGEGAFNYCTGLKSITLSDSVTSIGNGAFANCTGLTSVIIPNSVKSIGESAFNECTELISITIPDSVTSIGKNAFYNCTGLTSITIPDSVTSIENFAFYNCTGLTSITIPDSVTSIGTNAFAHCTGLTSVIIPNSVTSIGNNAFVNCTGLTSITIPDSVTSIGNNAFTNCAANLVIYCSDNSAAKVYADNNNITYKASHTVAYDLNNGAGTPPTDGNNYYENDDVTLALGTGLSKTNFTFGGWSTAQNGTAINGTTYTMGAENVTFYAVWNDSSKYTVTFDSMGGSTVASITNVINNTTISKPANPTKNGYNFSGWYKDSAAWNFVSDKVTSNITLTAKWNKIQAETPSPTPTTSAPTTTPHVDWTSVLDKITEAKDGETITVNMNGSTIVSGNVFSAIKGKNISVVIELDNGISWTINGMDVTGSDLTNMDLGVNSSSTTASQLGKTILNIEVINAQGVKEMKQITIAYDGVFPFKAILSLPLGASNSGKYANLYYISPKTNKIELQSSAVITSSGKANLIFNHASSYVIAISDKPALGELSAGASITDNTKPIVQNGMPYMVIVTVLAVGMIAVKQKKTRK